MHFYNTNKSRPGESEPAGVMMSLGINEGRLSIDQMVQVCCTSNARVFGLYPKKGVLQEGADADLVLVDPDVVKGVDEAYYHGAADWSIYYGWKLKGDARVTILRGKVMMEEGEVRGEPGWGSTCPDRQNEPERGFSRDSESANLTKEKALPMDVTQAVEKARTEIGREWGPLTLPIDPYWIRTFVEAIEDPNPLWLDDDFARQTPWGGTVVPPTALCSLMARFRMRLRPVLDMGWGTETVNAGVHYALPNPIRPGDQISCRFRVADVFSKVGRTGPLIFAVREQILTNQRGEQVLVGRQTTAHYQGTGLAERRPIPSPQRPSRTTSEAEGVWLDTIATSLQHDIGSGSFFEDVQVGQELPAASRGPIRTRDQVKWAASTEDWDEIHYDYIYCRQVGMPDVISNGNFGYCATAGRMLTDWLGTTGMLMAFSTSYRAGTYIGDTLTASGVITAKLEQDRTVDIQVTVRNQLGETAILGTATARLRSRAG